MRGQFAGHLEPEGVVLGGQHNVQQEQLANRIGNVEDLRDEKKHDEIVAQSVNNNNEKNSLRALWRFGLKLYHFLKDLTNPIFRSVRAGQGCTQQSTKAVSGVDSIGHGGHRE